MKLKTTHPLRQARRNRAIIRGSLRSLLTPLQQLHELDQRPGQARRERARLVRLLDDDQAREYLGAA